MEMAGKPISICSNCSRGVVLRLRLQPALELGDALAVLVDDDEVIVAGAEEVPVVALELEDEVAVEAMVEPFEDATGTVHGMDRPVSPQKID